MIVIAGILPLTTPDSVLSEPEIQSVLADSESLCSFDLVAFKLT